MNTKKETKSEVKSNVAASASAMVGTVIGMVGGDAVLSEVNATEVTENPVIDEESEVEELSEETHTPTQEPVSEPEPAPEVLVVEPEQIPTSEMPQNEPEPEEPTVVKPEPTEPEEPTVVKPEPTEPEEPTVVEPEPTEPEEPTVVEPEPTEPEIDVLLNDTITNDDGSLSDVAVLSVNGETVVMLDVDRDGEADLIGVDINHNEMMENDEIDVITGEGILMDEFMVDDTSLYADSGDYVNDANVDEYMA